VEETRRVLGPEARRTTISTWLTELERPAKQLSAWELNFLSSVSEQFYERGTLTDKQFDVLERIYAEKTA
jgi:hypothetical protein